MSKVILFNKVFRIDNFLPKPSEVNSSTKQLFLELKEISTLVSICSSELNDSHMEEALDNLPFSTLRF